MLLTQALTLCSSLLDPIGQCYANNMAAHPLITRSVVCAGLFGTSVCIPSALHRPRATSAASAVRDVRIHLVRVPRPRVCPNAPPHSGLRGARADALAPSQDVMAQLAERRLASPADDAGARSVAPRACAAHSH